MKVVSKIGISSVGGKRNGYKEFLQTIAAAGRALPGVVCRGNFGAVDEPLALWPDILTIGGVPAWDGPRFDVNEAYKRLTNIAAKNPKIRYWMYFNEQEDVETAMTDFYIKLLPRLHDAGVHMCLYNSSSGRPQYPEIDPVPYREVARGCRFVLDSGFDAVIGLHEYESVYGVHTVGRFKRLADYLEERQCLLPIAITEFGHETNDSGNADYMRFIREADPIYMADPRVKFCALWTLGREGWQGADYSSMLPELGQYIATVELPTPAPEPPPEPVLDLEARVRNLEERMKRVEKYLG